MLGIFTVCSRFNRNLLRNVISERFFVLGLNENNSKIDSPPQIVTLNPDSLVALKQHVRFYNVDTDNVQRKENWYSDEKFAEVQKQRNAHWMQMKITLIIMSTCLVVCIMYVVYALGSPKFDDSGNVIEDEFTQMPLPVQFLKRVVREIENCNLLIKQPVSKKLLPDPPIYPNYQPMYTLILEMNDLLVHADWTYQNGWRFKKRPGVDKFLEMVTVPMFELVVFTADHGARSIPLIEALDPNGCIIHKLTRDSTEFVEGTYIKNLDYLNRDLSKVIVVDWNENSVKKHRNNAILLPRWNGQDDTTLVDLAKFLRAIGSSEVDDVRDILTYYNQCDNPFEAYRAQQRTQLEQIEENEEHNQKKGINFASRWANTFLKLHRHNDNLKSIVINE